MNQEWHFNLEFTEYDVELHDTDASHSSKAFQLRHHGKPVAMGGPIAESGKALSGSINFVKKRLTANMYESCNKTEGTHATLGSQNSDC